MDQITDHNKRLKLCIKWFQQIEESHLLEEDRLRTALESAEKKCSAIGNSTVLIFMGSYWCQ